MNEIADAINNLAAVISSIYETELLLKYDKEDYNNYCKLLAENMSVNLGLLKTIKKKP